MPRRRRGSTVVIVQDAPERWTEEELATIQQQYQALQQGYSGTNAINTQNLSDADEQRYCERLVEGALRLLKLRTEDYPECFTACVNKCIATGVLQATTWSQWTGYKDVNSKTKHLAYFSDVEGKIYILPATSVIAAIVVKWLRKVTTDGSDVLMKNLVKYRTFEFAHASVKHYQEGNTDTTARPRMSKDGRPEGERGMMLELQQFETPFYKPRRAMPPPLVTITEPKSITRQEAQALFDPYYNWINSQAWSPPINDELANVLTKEIVLVLDSKSKSWLRIWCKQASKPKILQWVREANDDINVYVWNEIKEAKGELGWSATDPIFNILDDLEDLQDSEHITSEAVRRKIRDGTAMARYYITQMEPKWKEKAYKEAQEKFLQEQAAMKTQQEAMKTQQATIANDIAFTRKSIEQKDERLKKRKKTHDEAEANGEDTADQDGGIKTSQSGDSPRDEGLDMMDSEFDLQIYST
ncbi:hypothetical protein V8C42DRAFT_359825 [Trichoderma barbatum]